MAALMIAVIRAFVVQSFVIPTGSMEPALVPGDRVLVSRSSYLFGGPQRGDVIVFDGAGVFDPMAVSSGSSLAGAGRAIADAFGLPVGSRNYVKRVIGLPGERVTCCTPGGQLMINGVPLGEPYLRPGEKPSAMTFDVAVPKDRLWVMGDHRSDSADSRAHLGDPGGGTVPLDRVVGRVICVFWPTTHVGRLSTGPSGTIVPGTAEGTG
jgi:signal peptidase I